ncbi:MAG: peptidylprolyl isomerase [Pseudomonadota bacterium]
MNHRLYALFLAPLLFATGCDRMQTALPTTPQSAAGSTAATLSGEVIATVNGSAITQEVYDVYSNQRAAKTHDTEADRETILNELVALELMRQEAVSKGLTKQPLIAATLNQLERSTMAGAAIKDFMDNNSVSDEDAKQFYDKQVGVPGKEFKARHILVKTEDEAKEIIAELDKGKDFSELAKEKSTGPSGPSGGELGWFGASQMVKPFADAAAAMEKGTYSKTPVQTEFGWHVIMLDDTRDSTPPPFDDVKDRLKLLLANQNLQQHINTLRESAKVELKAEK